MRNYYRIAFLVTTLLVCWNDIQAQSIYGECFGNSSGLYTINYEHVLNDRGKNIWSIHGGIGIYNVRDLYMHKSFPLGVTYYDKKEGNHHKEVGLCLSYAEGLADNRFHYSFDGFQHSKTLLGILNVGYRYQKPEGGFMFKLYYAPGILIKEFQKPPYHFTRQTLYPLNLGISLGYKF